MTDSLEQQLIKVLGTPPDALTAESRRRVGEWFASAAPLVRWDVVETPLGPLYLAASPAGLCNAELGGSQERFLSLLDPLARVERDSTTLATIEAQFREYFGQRRARFELPLDLSRVSSFQRRVLQTILDIPAGTVWTYSQVAAKIGRPTASRAVGHALGTNPLMIVVPCHRVIASDGSLRGYRGGLAAKESLLRLEGAL